MYFNSKISKFRNLYALFLRLKYTILKLKYNFFQNYRNKVFKLEVIELARSFDYNYRTIGGLLPYFSTDKC